MNYSLPQAVIRFKQGFGRLIRSKSDRGAIFIFDNRITRTAYGSHFLHSLPKVQVVQKRFRMSYWTTKNGGMKRLEHTLKSFFMHTVSSLERR
ncbi:helicase C-terminal domain-containing protein [Priestia megaterium]